MPRGRSKREAKARRLIDPVPEIDVTVLIRQLAKTHRIDPDELVEFLHVPEEYDNEVPAVKAKNKGLNTIYGKMAHLRRRFLSLLLGSNEDSLEGEYIEGRLRVFEKEVVIIQNQITKMGGAYYTMPHVFGKPIALRS